MACSSELAPMLVEGNLEVAMSSSEQALKGTFSQVAVSSCLLMAKLQVAVSNCLLMANLEVVVSNCLLMANLEGYGLLHAQWNIGCHLPPHFPPH